jgi:hypothetical protein
LYEPVVVQVDCYFFQSALARGGKHAGEEYEEKLQGGTVKPESYG